MVSSSNLEVVSQNSGEENDNEISDAVRMVLEKDPFLNADQIRINTLNFTVILEGRVQTETQKELAESDVRHTVGVEKVINCLTVQN